MRTQIASIITLEEVAGYFEGSEWSTSISDGGVKADSSQYDVTVKPSGASFHVAIKAYDDESDSDEGVTDDPAKFIVDFLKTGTMGDAVFGKMAGLIRRTSNFGPSEFASVIRFVASGVEAGALGKKAACAAVRRLGSFPGITSAHEIQKCMGFMIKMAARDPDVVYLEMGRLQSKMRDKGWRSKVNETDEGMEMEVDVAGVYEVKIRPDSLMWDYTFKKTGTSPEEDHGITDDPIAEFQRFTKEIQHADTVPSEESGPVPSQEGKMKFKDDRATMPDKPKAPKTDTMVSNL